ncbi:MAG TPA: SDR family NAD(P)-dependent oxidoreductase [Kofleriaceae bacterium]|nr:SDR family NAD(P)-dependent oxidoreductase [Kofleriaceae bacterium]
MSPSRSEEGCHGSEAHGQGRPGDGRIQGIGAATARQLAAEGTRVALTYHRERARAEAIVAEIEQAGGEALCAALDLDDLESVQGCRG